MWEQPERKGERIDRRNTETAHNEMGHDWRRFMCHLEPEKSQRRRRGGQDGGTERGKPPLPQGEPWFWPNAPEQSGKHFQEPEHWTVQKVLQSLLCLYKRDFRVSKPGWRVLRRKDGHGNLQLELVLLVPVFQCSPTANVSNFLWSQGYLHHPSMHFLHRFISGCIYRHFLSCCLQHNSSIFVSFVSDSSFLLPSFNNTVFSQHKTHAEYLNMKLWSNE